MDLDEKVARIETLTKTLEKTINATAANYLAAVRCNAEELATRYQKRQKSKTNVKNRFTKATLAVSAKNTADALNLFLQQVYGKKKKIDLARLVTNTREAPRADTGETLAEIIQKTHKFQKDSPMMTLRDKMGGHVESQMFYDREMDLDSYSAEEIVHGYLNMVKTILDIVQKKDKRFSKRNNKIGILQRKYQRKIGRHKVALATAALVAGTAGGTLGTLAYQNYQEAREAKEHANLLSDIVTNQLDDWDRTVSSSLKFIETSVAEQSEQYGFVLGQLQGNQEAVRRIGRNIHEYGEYTLSLKEREPDEIDRKIMDAFVTYLTYKLEAKKE